MTDLRAKPVYFGTIVTVNPSKTTVYTVPAGHRLILKTVTARNLNSGLSNTVYVFIGGVLVWSWPMTAGPTSGGFVEWDTWTVIDELVTIQMAVSNATGASVSLSGSIHYLP